MTDMNMITKISTGYDHDELSAAFDAVANKDHWKGPVDSWVSTADLHKTLVAIEFFTATVGTVTGSKGAGASTEVHVEAPGYWAGPAN